MKNRPKITDAVLLLLELGPKNPQQLTASINIRDDFKPLREHWGTLSINQVYAAMSGLRSKGQDSRSSIVPEGGEPSMSKQYAITPYGRREIERRGLVPLKRVAPVSPANQPQRDTSVAWWPVDAQFRLGDTVKKRGKASWRGTIVGWYRTELTALGFAVESSFEPGSVQIYPQTALDPWDALDRNT